MNKTDAKTAVRELAMMLIYLSRITEEKDFSTAKSLLEKYGISDWV